MRRTPLLPSKRRPPSPTPPRHSLRARGGEKEARGTRRASRTSGTVFAAAIALPCPPAQHARRMSRTAAKAAARKAPRLPLDEPPLRPSFRRERAAMKRGVFPVAGADEAGRGPLAGPVVAAAVILDPKRIPRGLDDSKKLDHAAREKLYARICATAQVG